LTPALEKSDGGPAVHPLSLPEGLQADLAHLEDATEALLEGKADESLPVPAAKIVRDRSHAQPPICMKLIRLP
jgi:hypothetical protein